MNETPPPPVAHAANCLCSTCIDARRDELRRRLEEKRRDQRIEDMVYREELAGRGIVFAPVRKVQPGTLAAHAARYGKVRAS